jgi:hypothetical protein
MNSANSNNNSDNNSDKKNVLPDLKVPGVFYPFIMMIVLLVIGIFMIMYNITLPSGGPSTMANSKTETSSNILLILFILMIIVGLCIMFLDNLKSLKDFFIQTSGVGYTILYTIFLILFFRLMPSNTIDNYAFIILPITLISTIYVFNKGVQTNYVEEYNINYERIKSIILFFCFITTIIVYYNIDPGGYITKYFGSSLIFTIILSVFAFLYMVILLTLPKKDGSPASPITGAKSDNFFANFSNFSVYGSISFIVFLIIITFLISTYPGGFMNDKSKSTSVIILLLVLCILWVTLLGGFLLPEIGDKTIEIERTNLFKRSLLFLFGLVISGLLIFWIVNGVQNASGTSGMTSFILNSIIVLLVLAFIYRTMVVKFPQGNSKKDAFFEMIINLIFYIPCLFSNVFDKGFNFGKTEYDSSTPGSIIMLVIAILLYVVYFCTPYLFNLIYLQGGQLLVNKPVDMNTKYSLGTYQELNGSDTFDYQYAISSWIFINSATPNTNSSYSKYTSLLNFGGKPNVLYNGSTNTLMITMQQKDLKKTTKNKLTDFDEDGNRIIFIKHNVLLQKWNNIIINYSGGVLDIFLNGELVKSSIGVVPYYTLDNLTIGEDNGIKGGICNVVYFNRALTATNIYILYNMLKNRTLPVTNDSNVTITKKNMGTLSNSFN